jgi:acetoin utilization deacetylase AcuC-like enzyme
MKILFNSKFLEHNAFSEAEGAYRLKKFTDLPDTEYDGEPFITLVHTEEYKEMIRNASNNNDFIAEVSLTPESYQAACLSVGLSILAAETRSFAAIRPPGHHATADRATGFCFFNNIAIAARKLVNEGKRVFILDIDAHHGDGTQSLFYESDQVFYCSIHQHYAFPFTGFPEEKGKGKGLGYTLNLPIYEGSGNKEYLAAIDQAINAARGFDPDVIAVSAGFDGYEHDYLLSLHITPQGYYESAFRLRRAFSNIFAVLEGGYHHNLRKCVDSFVEGINVGARPPKIKWDPNLSIG